MCGRVRVPRVWPGRLRRMTKVVLPPARSGVDVGHLPDWASSTRAPSKTKPRRQPPTSRPGLQGGSRTRGEPSTPAERHTVPASAEWTQRLHWLRVRGRCPPLKHNDKCSDLTRYRRATSVLPCPHSAARLVRCLQVCGSPVADGNSRRTRRSARPACDRDSPARATRADRNRRPGRLDRLHDSP